MLIESIALYALALSAGLLAAVALAPRAFTRGPERLSSALLLALALILSWRVLSPFWLALRIGLYDARDALLSAAAAVVLLLLAATRRGRVD